MRAERLLERRSLERIQQEIGSSRSAVTGPVESSGITTTDR
jgi:hypothetical protein